MSPVPCLEVRDRPLVPALAASLFVRPAPNFLRHAAAGCYRGVQRLLDSGVFMRPEFGKPRECRRVYLVVTDAREPVAAPVNRKAPLVETWWMHAKV